MQIIKNLFAILILSILIELNHAQIGIYGQCGGQGFSGPFICDTTLKCQRYNVWFSQCLTSCPSGWECNNPLVPLNGQCGGNTYCGLTACDGGLTCYKKDSTISSCTYTCPSGWLCNSQLVGEYGQCGGQGYTGLTECSGSLKCFQKDLWFSQCLSYCPPDWSCKNCTVAPTTTQAASSATPTKTSTKVFTTTTTLKPVTTSTTTAKPTTTTLRPVTTSITTAKPTTTTLKPVTTSTTTTLRPVTTSTTTAMPTTTTLKPVTTSTTLKPVTTTSTTILSTTTTSTLSPVTIQSNDLITYIDYGGKIPAEDQIDIYFKYNADTNRDATISLIKPSESNKVYATKTVSITGGTDKNKAVTLTRSLSTPNGTGYVILIQFSTNNALTVSRSVSVTVEIGKQGFHCYQGKIYDANKNEFIMRGINNAHAYWDNYNRYYALNALDNIAATGANVVRIVWLKYLQGGLTLNDLDTIIATAIKNKLVPMIELHDATGSSDANYLSEMAQHLAYQVWLLIKYRKHIIVNIANEWSPWGTAETYWRDSYKTAIATIRNAGYSGSLVIDASAYAQNPNGPKLYGKDLIASDPYNNLIFSVHMYAQWSNEYPDYKIYDELLAIKTLAIPFIIGEFASQHPANINGNCQMVNLDYDTLMKQCQLLGFGYIGWSWTGNGYGDCGWSLSFLDIALNSNWEATSYSTWGNILVNNVNGIKATSKLATIF